jgi:hypothetical protein
MSQRIIEKRYDVVVIGGGSAGIAAACAAARNGAKTILVDAGPIIGGEFVSGIPIDGCISSRGDWVVGGIIRELFDECDRLGGYVGPLFDFRCLNVVCVDPEIAKIAVVNLVRRHGVELLLYTFAEDVVVEDGRVTGVVVVNKNQRTLLRGDVVIDCSGDGDVAHTAGAPFEIGDAATGGLQPVTLVFRMVGVDARRLLTFVRDNPEHFGLAEYPGMQMTREQAAQGLYDQGLPKAFMVSDGPLMKKALAAGDIYQSSMIAITPISMARREVSLNTTRVSYVDATKPEQLSAALPDLMDQVMICANFMRKYVPGFEEAVFSGIAPRIGIRETRRIMGEYVLTEDDILEARKFEDGIGKGCHELDVHGVGTGHRRVAIKDGGSYDIPFGSLIPLGFKNLLVAGRCFSSTREGHSSARVMGTCMAMGQAAGTAAAMLSGLNRDGDVRDLSVAALRETLREQGAVLDGIL